MSGWHRMLRWLARDPGRSLAAGRLVRGLLRWPAGKPARRLVLLGALIVGLVPVLAWPWPRQQSAAPVTYAGAASAALRTLEHRYYNGAGLWRMCVPITCAVRDQDWGADSLTFALYLHWQLTHDRHVRPIMNALAINAHTYTRTRGPSSDVAAWDAVALAREYQVTGSRLALAKAAAAFAWADSPPPPGFAAGACPAIDYQKLGGGRNHLKTLETDSNYVKAALLLYQITGRPSYLARARARYAAARRYFLAGGVPLYTVYVFDTGRTCTQLRARFYASVNGNMIWAGQALARATGQRGYLRQAVATARAVTSHLSDAAGVFADLQAENDVTEPLIEAMYDLSVSGRQRFAGRWLLAAAGASAADASAAGSYGRFFDGPPPSGPVTAWQANGGLALQFAAAAIDPQGSPADPGFWRRARLVPRVIRLAGRPVRFSFTGRAIAIIGAIGQRCCEAGHARVVIDGIPTFDRTGIWQNKSSAGRRLPGEVLLAWRWLARGRHTITIWPGIANAKEGGSYFRMTGYLVVP